MSRSRSSEKAAAGASDAPRGARDREGAAGAGESSNEPEKGGSESGHKDEGKKSYGQILSKEIEEGLAELIRPATGLLLSGLSAGLDVGFSIFLMAVGITVLEPGLSEPVLHIFLANMYAVGFIFVILGRSELFTEHTTLAVFPVLGGSVRLRRLGRLWGLVYLANLVGATIFALLMGFAATSFDVVSSDALTRLAMTMADDPSHIIFMSAVLAGWLMGLLSWLVAAARDTTSQIIVVWLVTTVIGFGQLHHCIVGTVEVLSGVFGGEGVSLASFLHFLLWATLGNAVGGVLFVAIIKYSHAVKRRPF